MHPALTCPAWLAGLTTFIALHLPAPRYRQAIAAVALKCLPIVTHLAKPPLSKGAPKMNAFQIATVAVTLGEDAINLFRDVQANNKTQEVADIVAAVPAIAEATGQDAAHLAELLTVESVGAAFDFVFAAEKLIAAVEAHFAPAASQAPEAPAEQPAA